MKTLKRSMLLGIFLVALILATAACQSNDSPEESMPVPTQTAPPTRTLPPTWTPAPPSPSRPTSTLVPTFTPRPSPTLTPGVTPGAALLDDGSLAVIIEEETLNRAIRTVYQDSPPELLSMAPEIRFPFSGRAVIDLVFFNTFLNQRGTVNARVLIESKGGNLVISEIIGEREHEGILVADDSIRQALALAENGINNAVMEMAQSQPGEFQMESVQVRIGWLEVIFRSGGEITPVG